MTPSFLRRERLRGQARLIPRFSILLEVISVCGYAPWANPGEAASACGPIPTRNGFSPEQKTKNQVTAVPCITALSGTSKVCPVPSIVYFPSACTP